MYTGVAQNLSEIARHTKSGQSSWFVRKYDCSQLVWYKQFPDIDHAIAWQETLNGWSRSQKVALIEQQNPYWRDLRISLATHLL